MKLYNTLSRKIEEIKPIADQKIGLYACGPTVYDYTHLGHLRKYSMDDVLIRALRHSGFSVEFIQNITDVGHLASDADTGEDKLEKGAKKYGKSVWDIAHEFEDYFWYSMDKMGNLRPDVSCRATEHIESQLEMVKALEKKGFTYIIEGDGVYFDTSKLPDYGKLARLKLEDQKEGARVSSDAKKNPSDFALWKFEREGENRAMVWESPWAKRSFPGWHIECSAMAMEYLGEQFEIHTGGIDHIPVHHTNEIAQAEGATGKKPFVKYWVHHNFLRVNNEKMSKSLGNVFNIDDVLERGFSPQALRLLFLMTHYRSEMNFTWEALEGAEKAWERLLGKVAVILIPHHTWCAEKNLSDEAQKSAASPYKDPSTSSSTSSEFAQDDKFGYKTRFFDFIQDDLRTPEALAVMWEVLDSKQLSGSEKLELILEFDEVLGLGLDKPEAKSQKPKNKMTLEVRKLLEERKKAREKKDWQKADKIREELEKLGFLVKDTQEGQQLVAKSKTSNS